MRTVLIATFILRLGLPAGVMAQGGGGAPPADSLASAAAAFNGGQWRDAYDRYAAIAARYPSYGLAKFRMGVALTALGTPAKALPLLREGERLGVPAGPSAYRLAQAFAALGQADSAIAELRRSAAAGFYASPSAVSQDPHFASLGSRTDWRGVLDAFDAVVHPCEHDARFREFDFWLGDWDVRPNGASASTPPSRNVVTREEDGCVVMEHWTGVGGSTGMSFNLFDRSVGKWRQTWVDNGGGQHDYAGSLAGVNMAFEGTTPDPSGGLGRVPTRLTFFRVSADTVRQFSESSTDGGKTWTVNYDLIYVRRHP